MRILSHLSLALVVVGALATTASCASKPTSIILATPKMDSAAYVFGGDAVVACNQRSITVCYRNGKHGAYKLPADGNALWPGAALMVSPNGVGLLYQQLVKSSGATTRVTKLRLLDLKTGHSRSLCAWRGTIEQARYSPDGRRLALALQEPANKRYCLAVVDAAGGRPRIVKRFTEQVVMLLGWSADSGSVLLQVCETMSETTMTVSVRGGATKEVVNLYRSEAGGPPVVEPAGDTIYCTRGGVVQAVVPNAEAPRSVLDRLKTIQWHLPMLSSSREYVAANGLGMGRLSGACVLEARTGRAGSIMGTKDEWHPGCEFLGWHPGRDLMLVSYVTDKGTELREYDPKDVIQGK